MEFSAKQIAGLLNGTIDGDENVKISQLAKIEEGIPGSISFLSNPLYTQYVYNTKASIVIINKGFNLTAPVTTTLIWVDSAEMAFAKLLEMYNQVKLNKSGISKLAFISETAKIGSSIYAGEFSFIGENAVIGNNVKIPTPLPRSQAELRGNITLRPSPILLESSFKQRAILLKLSILAYQNITRLWTAFHL